MCPVNDINKEASKWEYRVKSQHIHGRVLYMYIRCCFEKAVAFIGRKVIAMRKASNGIKREGERGLLIKGVCELRKKVVTMAQLQAVICREKCVV